MRALDRSLRHTLRLALAWALAGCALIQPQVEPVAPPPVGAGGPQPTGPSIEIGRGEMLGLAWRYSVFESTDGTCTQFDVADMMGSSMSCGAGLGLGGEAVMVGGIASGTHVPTTIEGVAGHGVDWVVVEAAHGEQFAAALMSLAPAGLDGQAFVAILPGQHRYVRVVGYDAAGEQVGEHRIDN